MEYLGAQIKGIYRDRLHDEHGRLVFDSGWKSNTIVIGCRKLISGFMMNDASSGIQHLAVGQGLESWDDDTPDVPVTDSQLHDQAPDDEVTLKQNPTDTTYLTMTYLDSNGIETDAITNRLQVTAVLGPGYPEHITDELTYPLREFGLFGKYFNGTDDEFFMINCIRHPVIHKGLTATLERIVQLEF